MGEKRGSRGGGAALYAARQTADVTPTAEEIAALGDDPDITVIEEPVEEDDEPPVDTEDEPAEEEEEDPGDDTEPALTTMQRQLAEMQAENERLRKQAADSDLDTAVSQQAVLAQALNNAKQRAIDAEMAIEAASAAGDHKGVAKATAALSKAIQDQDRFELAADEMAAEVEERKKPKPREQQRPADDPYVASLKPFSEPSREWLIKHRQHIEGNQKAGLKAQGLAQLAISEGIEVDSPEFFEYLDKGMGFEVSKQKPAPKRNKPAPARPQTGAPTGNRGGTGRPTEVVLTAAQRNAALAMGMTLKEYAKSVVEIQKNGQDPNRPGVRFSAHTAHSSRR